MSDSLCTFPTFRFDLSVVLALAMIPFPGFPTLPTLPTLPIPSLFCPLD